MSATPANAYPPICGTCDQAIQWAMTRHGELLPIDAEPDPAGNIILEPAPDYPNAQIVRGHRHGQLEILEPDRRPRYMPHWETCRHAYAWRSDYAAYAREYTQQIEGAW